MPAKSIQESKLESLISMDEGKEPGSNSITTIGNGTASKVTSVPLGTAGAPPCASAPSSSNILAVMPRVRIAVDVLLDRLETFYGPQQPNFPVDPYEFLVWWYCGYPASDAACARGWSGLTLEIGTSPEQLLQAKPAALAAAIKPGGMLPELRGERLKELAMRVQDEFGGDLRAGLSGPTAKARKILKQFHSIADPGADRILLFAGLAPIAAVPSNCVHVLDRIMHDRETKNYSAAYREAQRTIATEVPEKFDARTRAYLLLKQHGQQLCKRTNPKCDECPLRENCAYAGRS
jgi:endonuclease-3